MASLLPCWPKILALPFLSIFFFFHEGAYLAQLDHPQAFPAIASTFKLCELIFDEQSLFSLMFVVQPEYRLGDTLWYSWIGEGVRRLSKVVKGFHA